MRRVKLSDSCLEVGDEVTLTLKLNNKEVIHVFELFLFTFIQLNKEYGKKSIRKNRQG